METFERGYRGEVTTFKIYKKEEADKIKLPYLYWREAKEPGWVLTDDNYVGELLYIKTYKTFIEHTYSFGKTNQYSKHLKWEERRLNKAWHTLSVQSAADLALKKTRVKNAAMVYAKMMLLGKMDWEKIGRIMSPKAKHPIMTGKLFAKSKGVKKLIGKELERQLDELGISDKSLIEDYREVIKMAKKKQNPDALLRVINKLAEYRGWNDQTTVEATNTYDYSLLEEGIQRNGQAKIKASKIIRQLPMDNNETVS